VGLGLHLSLLLAQFMDGNIEVESLEKIGTKVKVSLVVPIPSELTATKLELKRLSKESSKRKMSRATSSILTPAEPTELEFSRIIALSNMNQQPSHLDTKRNSEQLPPDNEPRIVRSSTEKPRYSVNVTVSKDKLLQSQFRNLSQADKVIEESSSSASEECNKLISSSGLTESDDCSNSLSS